MTKIAAIVLYCERFQAGICWITMACPWKLQGDYMNGGFAAVDDKGPALPVQWRLHFQFIQGQTQVKLKWGQTAQPSNSTKF